MTSPKFLRHIQPYIFQVLIGGLVAKVTTWHFFHIFHFQLVRGIVLTLIVQLLCQLSNRDSKYMVSIYVSVLCCCNGNHFLNIPKSVFF